MVPCRWGWYDGILLHILYRRQVHLHLAKGRLRLGRRHSIFVPFECWWNWSAKVDCQDRSWVSHARTKNGFNKQSRKRLWLCQSAPLRCLLACLLPFHWPEEAIKPLSIVDTNKARSHKRGTHISNPFCSVPFRSVSSRSRWRESQLPPVTHCAVHRLLSFLVMLTLENTGSAAHSPLATRRIRPPKVKGPSRISPVPTESMKKARSTRVSTVTTKYA